MADLKISDLREKDQDALVNLEKELTENLFAARLQKRRWARAVSRRRVRACSCTALACSSRLGSGFAWRAAAAACSGRSWASTSWASSGPT